MSVWTRRLAPVRRRVPFRRVSPGAAQTILRTMYPSREWLLFGSGTQALAAALLDAKQRHSNPEAQVILPAYGCPDLVAAATHAGLRVRLVDNAADCWGYDPNGLSEALRDATAAIVAVNLLGVPENLPALRDAAEHSGAVLIHDHAQRMARSGLAESDLEYEVVSFGRGKPLNLLGGGALVLSPQRASTVAARHSEAPSTFAQRAMSSAFAALMFNVATHPRAFTWVGRIPGMGLGETRYRPLQFIRRPPIEHWRRVAAALEQFERMPGFHRDPWTSALEGWRDLGISPLSSSDAAARVEKHPLRLALLAPSAQLRDRIVRALHAAGLGATSMYATQLAHVTDIPATIAAQGPFPHAHALGERLWTLPTHESLTPADVARADAIVRRVCATSL